MKQFPEMWIPCSEQEYPEVKQLLEGMGHKVYSHLSAWTRHCVGVSVYSDGTFQPVVQVMIHRPTVTLPELRLMAAQPDPQPTEPDNLAALETLFANFIEAVAEMRTAQTQYYKTPASRRPEALGIKLKHEREVDAMIQDVTRKPL